MDKQRLVLELECELEQLSRLSKLAQDLSTIGPTDRRSWDAAAAAKFIADFWLGFENLCKRRYAFLRQEPPSGANSHRRILQDFLSETELGSHISEPLKQNLKKYLSFRHRFIHGYGYLVSWDMVEEPLRLLPETVALIHSVWERWLSKVK